jgi:hypothetical protein
MRPSAHRRGTDAVGLGSLCTCCRHALCTGFPFSAVRGAMPGDGELDLGRPLMIEAQWRWRGGLLAACLSRVAADSGEEKPEQSQHNWTQVIHITPSKLKPCPCRLWILVPVRGGGNGHPTRAVMAVMALRSSALRSSANEA